MRERGRWTVPEGTVIVSHRNVVNGEENNLADGDLNMKNEKEYDREHGKGGGVPG